MGQEVHPAPKNNSGYKSGIAKRSALAHKKVADEKWACRRREESNVFTPTQGGEENLTSRVQIKYGAATKKLSCLGGAPPTPLLPAPTLSAVE